MDQNLQHDGMRLCSASDRFEGAQQHLAPPSRGATRPYTVAGSVLALALVGSLIGLSGCSKESDERLLASAQTYVDAKDWAAATIQIKGVLQKNPNSGTARLLLGKTLLETGAATEAMVELRKAQELGIGEELTVPPMARALILSGETAKVTLQYAQTQLNPPAAQADLSTSVAVAYAMQNMRELAQRYSEQALRSVPQYPQALILQARLRASEGQIEPAMGLLEQVLAKDPTDDRAGVMKAELLWQSQRNPQAALEVLNKLIQAAPKSVNARVALVGVLSAQDKISEVKAQHLELQKLAPNHPDTQFIEAQLAFHGGNYTAAREICLRILKFLPDSVRVLALAGAAEYRLNNFVPADGHLARALKLQPGNLLVRQLLAQTYIRAGQAGKAIEVLGPVLESGKADGASLALAGEAYLQTGDTRRSDEAFKRAAQIGSADPKVRTTLAMVQFARGETGQAMSELQAIASADKNPRADLALISAKLRNNDFAGALTAAQALQAKMPDKPLPDLLRGRILAYKQDLAGASAAYEAALKKDAGYFPAVSSLAAIDVAAGRGPAARKRLEEFIAKDATNHHAFLALAEVQSRTGGTPTEVAKTLAAGVKANPNQATPRLALVEQHLRMGDNQAALVAAQDGAAALPADASIMGALGRAQLASGDAQQAVTTFSKLVALSPNVAQNHMHLAEAYVQGKDVAAARRALQKAAELEPDNFGPRRAMAAIALTQNRSDEALDIAKALQRTKPKDFNGYVLEGDILRQQRKWQAAVGPYRTAFGLARGTEQAVRLHQAYAEAGQKPEAERFAAEWVREQPADAAFRYYLGDTALTRGELVAAESHYRAVLQAQPRNALALNNVAWLLAKQGKPGSVQVAEEAISLMPNRPAMVDTLAMAHASEKNFKRAVEVQRQAIALTKNDPTLRLTLSKYLIQAGDKAQARAELEDLARLGDKFASHREVNELLQSVR